MNIAIKKCNTTNNKHRVKNYKTKLSVLQANLNRPYDFYQPNYSKLTDKDIERVTMKNLQPVSPIVENLISV